MKIRIGIDVGGTFTHAVAIDNDSLAIAAKACRPTTHRGPEGVARGIWECLEALLETGKFAAGDVVFVAHSTTQATNALLEGDVAAVGLVGIGDGAAGAQAKRELSFSSVSLQGDKEIPVRPLFLKPEEIEKGIPEFAAGEGKELGAFVVAEPFGVDDPAREKRAVAVFSSLGLPATASHEVSGLYGLKARARTSVVNASILPKMMEVAEKTQAAVDRLGLAPTLTIMRSDGGVMTAAGMKKTPILTILSGPAAGVSAAVLYEKIANGLFVEIGGTSTDISAIVNGKPQVKQAVVGGNVLYLKTLDVRTVGVAGGSMIRISGGKFRDAGPRSAHIAGLGYACFSDPAGWADPRVKFISPIAGDPRDYAAIETGGGVLAVTTTCAANALGMLDESDYSRGNAAAARKAFELLAAGMGAGAEELARQVIEAAAGKIERVCRELMKEYPVEAAQLVVVGGGGGASVLAPAAARKLSLKYRKSKDPEVISAVGAGMALMKTVLEKSLVDPTDGDIRAIRAQAISSLVESGADPDKIEVEIEVDRQKNVVRASATGATALTANRSQDKIDAAGALAAAKETLGGDFSLETVFDDGACFVVRGRTEKKGFLGLGKKVASPVVVVDSHGLARLTLRNADVHTADRGGCIGALEKAIAAGTVYSDGGEKPPAAYVVFGARIADLSKLADPGKMKELAAMEIAEHPGSEKFCILIAR